MDVNVIFDITDLKYDSNRIDSNVNTNVMLNPHTFLRGIGNCRIKKDNATKYLFIFVLIIELLRNTIGFLPALEKLWLPFVEILSERFNFR